MFPCSKYKHIRDDLTVVTRQELLSQDPVDGDFHTSYKGNVTLAVSEKFRVIRKVISRTINLQYCFPIVPDN